MNPFVMMCVFAIQTGRMTIEQVPMQYHDEVIKELSKLE
jgi:hypothetical protein